MDILGIASMIYQKEKLFSDVITSGMVGRNLWAWGAARKAHSAHGSRCHGHPWLRVANYNAGHACISGSSLAGATPLR